MKISIKEVATTILAVLLLSCTDSEKKLSADYRIIPLPVKIEKTGTSSFTLSGTTRIGYPAGNEKAEQLAAFLSDYIKEVTGFQPETTEGMVSSNGINLLLEDISENSPEAYRLEVNNKTVSITGKSEAGLFY
ncbi:glycoside hydrolase family 20 zincin-like fold domain-containing protein, partial [uncultured Parabacteroides sp.]|uniref:glycoside hydrolase family 20 zincin-like fold domain-containing protein n=1 Tax=uncultured Parabacteroides sp. TaxID=512312 RepID=UPI0025832CCA